MAKCEKCGNSFYSKECPHCKQIAWKKSINQNNKVDSSKYNPRKNTNNYKVCEKCGKTYHTKVCVPCRNREEKGNYNHKSKINIPMTIIAVAVSIIAIILVSKEYKEYQQEQQVMKLLYGTTDYDEVEKINNDMIKSANKMIEQGKKDMIKANKELEEARKKWQQNINSSQRGN